VAFAGLEKMVHAGVMGGDETVIVNCTGHTFPVEKHVLGDHFAVDVHLSEDQAPAPREGLQAAIENLDEKTTSILIVDDNEDDALLIRRLLENRKAYRLAHARDGWEGLALARQKLPDLIITDLMMAGIDGFGLVEELRLDPRTRLIPIVVVSAKTSRRMKKTAERQYRGFYQKGSLQRNSWTVIQVIEDKNVVQEIFIWKISLCIEATQTTCCSSGAGMAGLPCW
jgi:threonine synthase